MCATTPQRISSSVSDDIKEDASIYNNKLDTKKNDEKIPITLCEFFMFIFALSFVV